MSRWIDAEWLKESYTMIIKAYSGGIMERPAVLLETIEDAPSLDLVRCGECRYYRDYDGCFFSTEFVDVDGFCSYGERREDE